MSRAFTPIFLVLLALSGCGGATEPATQSGRPDVVELVQALQEGGLVVYLRHAATDRSKEDDLVVELEDCSTQRNLSDQGRDQSRTIGRAFQALEIPIGEVLSSEYCRTRETADLAFGRPALEPALTGFPEPGDPSFDRRVRETKELLTAPPADGENTVLVAHVKNLEEAVGVSIEEGELAVFEPLGGTRYRYLGHIPAGVWPQLVEQLQPD
jgi:phosphohistidine phosphatase SixA